MPLGSWKTQSSVKISSMAARRRAGSFSPKTSSRLRVSKVDMLYDMSFVSPLGQVSVSMRLSHERKSVRGNLSLPGPFCSGRCEVFAILARRDAEDSYES